MFRSLLPPLALTLLNAHDVMCFFLVERGEPKGPIVQLFEWRFDDIAEECEQFLGPNGYTGVQVSPVTESVSLDGDPWHERYQPISYKIGCRSGNRDQFHDMVRRCAKSQVKVYVEVVINHMTKKYKSKVYGTEDSLAYPAIYDYPDVPYIQGDFRPLCNITDYNNATEVRNCALDGLLELDQSKHGVRCKISQFLNELIELGVAGFSISHAKYMWPEDLRAIIDRLDYLSPMQGFGYFQNPFIYQEFVEGGAVKPSEYYDLGLVTDFKYGFELSQVFSGKKDLKELKNLVASDRTLVFVDNHLTQRGQGFEGTKSLTYREAKRYTLANLFMLAWPHGQPRIMSGYEFQNVEEGPPKGKLGRIAHVKPEENGTCANGWTCEHRWLLISQMVKFRRYVKNLPVEKWWDNGKNQIAFSRGDKGFVVFNLDSTDMSNVSIKTSLPGGSYCDIFSGFRTTGGQCTGKRIIVAPNGITKITLNATDEYGVIAIFLLDRLPYLPASINQQSDIEPNAEPDSANNAVASAGNEEPKNAKEQNSVSRSSKTPNEKQVGLGTGNQNTETKDERNEKITPNQEKINPESGTQQAQNADTKDLSRSDNKEIPRSNGQQVSSSSAKQVVNADTAKLHNTDNKEISKTNGPQVPSSDVQQAQNTDTTKLSNTDNKESVQSDSKVDVKAGNGQTNIGTRSLIYGQDMTFAKRGVPTTGQDDDDDDETTSEEENVQNAGKQKQAENNKGQKTEPESSKDTTDTGKQEKTSSGKQDVINTDKQTVSPDKPKITSTDRQGLSDTSTSSSTTKQDSSSSSTQQNPNADTKKLPNTDNKETSKTSSQQVPNADTKKLPNTDNKETSITSSQQVPNADTKKLSNTDNKGTSTTNSQQVLSGGEQQVPNADTKKLSNTDNKGTSTTNSQQIPSGGAQQDANADTTKLSNTDNKDTSTSKIEPVSNSGTQEVQTSEKDIKAIADTQNNPKSDSQLPGSAANQATANVGEQKIAVPEPKELPILGRPWFPRANIFDVPGDDSDEVPTNGDRSWKPYYNSVTNRKYIKYARVVNLMDNTDKKIIHSFHRRGFVLINRGKDDMIEVPLETELPPGLYCDVITGSPADSLNCTGRQVLIDPHAVGRFTLEKKSADDIIILRPENTREFHLKHAFHRRIPNEKWNEVYKTVKFSVHDQTERFYKDIPDDQYAMRKGKKGFMVFKSYISEMIDVPLQTGLPSGLYCDMVSGDLTAEGECTGKKIAVQPYGVANFTLDADNNLVVIHEGSMIEKVLQ